MPFCFCIKYSKILGTPISKRLKRLRNKYNLTWLKISISYSRYTNLAKKFNSDLTNKVIKNIVDYNKMDRPCNCDKRYLKKDQTCLFEGFCQRSTVVYKLKCQTTGKCYIGKTQRYFKERTAEHVCDVWYVVRSGRKKYGDEWYGNGGYKKADSFAKHFANLCRECRNQNQV